MRQESKTRALLDYGEKNDKISTGSSFVSLLWIAGCVENSGGLTWRLNLGFGLL